MVILPVYPIVTLQVVYLVLIIVAVSVVVITVEPYKIMYLIHPIL